VAKCVTCSSILPFLMIRMIYCAQYNINILFLPERDVANFLAKIQVRFAIVIRHITQSTTACLVAMTKGNLGTLTWYHWKIALTTGFGVGIISLLTSFGKLIHLQTSRFGVAFVAFAGTTISDYLSHPSNYGNTWTEALVTGVGAALLSLIVSFTPMDKFIDKLQQKSKKN